MDQLNVKAGSDAVSGKRTEALSERGVTARAVVLGLLCEALLFAWVAESEIVKSVYLICYSLLMPAVTLMVGLTIVNALVRVRFPQSALRRGEMLTIYIMVTCALPIAGFGAMRFLILGLGVPFYFASPENSLADYQRHIPRWLLPRSEKAIHDMFRGQAAVPWGDWLVPMIAWGSFLLALAFAWLCISILLRRHWVQEERLTFPIAYLPLQMTEPGSAFFKNKLMWIGFLIPAVMQSLLALNYLYPSVPAFQLKAWFVDTAFTSRPWNAIGSFPIGFYPTAIGLAYFVPTDISFSCWFFYLLIKAERVIGSTFGLEGEGVSQAASRFPYPEEQAAGAWIAFALISLWTARRYFRAAYQWIGARSADPEYRLYRMAGMGLAACSLFIILFAFKAGLPLHIAVGIHLVYALYIICGSRIRAEVGSIWTFAPLVWTPSRLTTSLLGTASLAKHTLVISTVFETINVDLRGQPMPNQLEGMKIADSVRMNQKKLALAIVIALLVGVGLAYWTTLRSWYPIGAATAKGNQYALDKARLAFDDLTRTISNVSKPDWAGAVSMTVAGVFTVFLSAMRVRFLWWVFHPIGYVISNTLTITAFWLPFFIAWGFKVMILRYGGVRIYRQSVYFFTGIVLGDILAQSLWTLAGQLMGFKVYQFLS
ncbi:MAG: hypothetical protein IT210_24880 [Armatimonadetes bacterium]|nr:hypothetical protein [Armatimonadota bacterium]